MPLFIKLIGDPALALPAVWDRQPDQIPEWAAKGPEQHETSPSHREEREIHPRSPDRFTVILEYWDSAYPVPQLHVSCNFLTSYFITR